MDMVKAVRVKKYVMDGRKMVLLPTWSTDAEIAYQALVQEFNKQMLPNNKVSEGDLDLGGIAFCEI
jgi:hypothetical protein